MSKENTLEIKGVAILCMVFFHLFAFPERVPELSAVSWVGTPLTKAFQICVPIYLFLAGYGLQCVSANRQFTATSLFKRIKRLYAAFWWISVPFILTGVAIGYYPWEPLRIFRTLLGVTSDYNYEWWFFSNYLELLILFGCSSMWGKMRLSPQKAFIGLVCILLISRSLSLFLPLSDCGIAGRHIRMIFVNINIFLLGVSFAKFNIFNSLEQYTKGLFARKWVIALFLTLPIVSRAYLPMKGVTELITVPVFCIGIVNLCKIKKVGGGYFKIFRKAFHEYVVDP